ncbi:hypothetical protein SESBI_32654 [Sesbania bispinosa]|nr:hypothetical protein SESBI_32654 [Sesbania bispinosa]
MGSWQKSFSSHSISGRRLCLCGDEIVTLISGTGKNPGRKFLRILLAAISSNGLMKISEEVKGNAKVEANVTVVRL